MLLLLFGLSILCSLDVLAKEKIFVNLIHGNCAGVWPSNPPVLVPHSLYLVVTDPTTKIVQSVHYLNINPPRHGVHDIYGTYDVDSSFKYKNPSDVKAILYVKTAMDEKMTGIDHPIYYGRPAYVDFSNFTGEPLKDLKDSPFRISKVIVKHLTKDKTITLIELGTGRCHQEVSEAWIANHGMYRICGKYILDDKITIPVYESIYYMPHPGMYHEPKCSHED